jgi:predicted membrane channel-forming protein YqfA (hemolysin III family)
MAKPFFTEHAGRLSLLISLLSGFVVAVALADMSDGNLGLDGWSAYLLVGGFLVFLVGIIWFATFLKNVRDLKTFLDEKSKAAFVKNLDDAEYVAWKLPMKYEEELAAKKRSFGIK